MEGRPDGSKRKIMAETSKFSLKQFLKPKRSQSEQSTVQDMSNPHSPATAHMDSQLTDLKCQEREKELFQAQIVEQGTRLQKLKEDKSELETKVASQDSQLGEIQLELSLRREEAQNNQRKLSSLKQETQELKKEKEALIEALEDSQREASEAREQATRLQEEVEALKRDKDSFTRALSESEMQLRQLVEISNIPELSLRKTGKRVASGAFGDVFFGLWRGVYVAVKSFHEEIQEGSNRRLFEQEIAVCCRIHHPNIVCTFGILRVTDMMPEIVMELLECSLAQLMTAALKSPRYLTAREQLDICADLVAGVVYLHEMLPEPLLHGDIRGSNVLITTTMGAKIADFGASHYLRGSLSIGPLSLDYLAPERMPTREGSALGNTQHADVYSLGVTVVEVLTGECAVRTARHRQIRQVTHDKLRDICLQMTGDRADDRPTAHQVYQVIEVTKKNVEYDRCPPRRKVRRIEEGNQYICTLSALA